MAKIIAFFLFTSLAALAAPSLSELDRTAKWKAQPISTLADYIKKMQAEHRKKALPEYQRPPMNENEIDYDAEYTMAFDVGVKSTIPILESSSDEIALSVLLSVRLVDFLPNGAMLGNGDAIQSWETSEDLSMDKIVLRDDLDWSDGKTVTAEDVVFSINTINHEKVVAPVMRTVIKSIKEVVAYGPKTFVVFHKEKLASNRMSLWFRIIPKHIFESTVDEDPLFSSHPNHLKFDGEPVTCGPYNVKSRDRSGELVLARKESWYSRSGKAIRHKPYFKTIRMKKFDAALEMMAFRVGDLVVKNMGPQEYATFINDKEFLAKNYLLRTSPSGFSYFGWNNTEVPFNDPKVRKAMAYTMDYNELHKVLGFDLNERAAGIYHKHFWRGEKIKSKPLQQNLELAEELLDSAGWTDGDNDGIRDKVINGKRQKLEFTILTSQAPLNQGITVLFKQQCEHIGVTVNIKSLEPTVLFSSVSERKYKAFYAAWGWDPNYETDASIFSSGTNYYGYSNKKVDALFERVGREPNLEKQKEIFGQINDIIFEDQPITPIWHQVARWAIKKRISGFTSVNGDPYAYYPEMLSIWAKKR